MSRARCCRWAAFVLLVLAGSDMLLSRAHAASGPQEVESGPLRRQLWHIAFPAANVEMRTLIFRPPGRGPFPLAVINHGSTQDAESRTRLPMQEFEALTNW